MRRFTFVLAAVLLTIFITAPGVVYAKKVVLTNYWFLDRKALQYAEGLKYFMEGVTKRTNGEITFKDFCCGELGDDVETMEQMREGSIHIRTAGLLLYGRYVKEIDNIGLPFLFRDYAHVWKFVSSDLFFDIVAPLREAGMEPIACYNAGFRDVQSVDKNLKTVDDAKGYKIVIAPIKVWTKVWEYFDAHPVVMPPAEFYMSMKTKIVDGAAEAATNSYAYKINETCDYYIQLQWSWMGPLMCINKEVFDSLTKEQQKIIREEAMKSSKRTFDVGKAKNEETIRWLETKGVKTIWDPDKSTWMKKASEAYKSFEGMDWYRPDIVKSIRAIK